MNTVDHLMQPRFQIIAGYPLMKKGWDNLFIVGRILTTPNIGWAKNQLGFDLADYPHLFKPLAWWEHRKESEMPEYVKHGENGKPKKVNRIYRDMFIEFEGGRTRRLNAKYLPCTPEDHLQYINKK